MILFTNFNLRLFWEIDDFLRKDKCYLMETFEMIKLGETNDLLIDVLVSDRIRLI